MVFGFGKKKTHEQPSDVTVKEKMISLEEVPTLLQDIESPLIEGVVNTGKLIKNEIEINRKKIHELILQLESDDLKLDDIDKNLMMIVKRGKNSIVSIIKKETSSHITDVTKYDQVVLFNLEISQILKRIGDVLGLNSRIIHIFAKKYADSLKGEIAKMSSNRNRLQTAINSIENLRSDRKGILNMIEKILEEKTDCSQKSDRVLEINSEIHTLKNNIVATEEEIFRLKSTKEYAKFLEIKSNIELISLEKNDIRHIIDLQFSKISRPLSKYSYISSFEKSVMKILDELISDPYQVISLQNKNTIIQILEAAAKSALSGSISVKDTNKSFEQIQETIKRLDEFIALKDSYFNKISILEKDLVVFDIKLLESKEDNLQKTKTDFTNMENLKKKLEMEIDQGQSKLAKKVSEMESNMSNLTNTKINLRV